MTALAHAPTSISYEVHNLLIGVVHRSSAVVEEPYGDANLHFQRNVSSISCGVSPGRSSQIAVPRNQEPDHTAKHNYERSNTASAASRCRTGSHSLSRRGLH